MAYGTATVGPRLPGDGVGEEALDLLVEQLLPVTAANPPAPGVIFLRDALALKLLSAGGTVRRRPAGKGKT